MDSLVKSALSQSQDALTLLIKNDFAISQIAKAGDLIAKALSEGNRVMSCGNGGSMCDAMHFAEELSGKFRDPRRPLAAISISDPAHLTCTGNDFGFDQVFSRFVEAHGRNGDVLLAISTSGKSQNILNAVVKANALHMPTIGLTGIAESPLTKACSLAIVTASNTPYSDRVQELHIKVLHILIEICEHRLFS
jgi:D-sedoheptulose 7-phosphate isomerase